MDIPPDDWLHAVTGDTDYSAGECGCTKQGQIRHWNRTVFVPAGATPFDVITTGSLGVPLPRVHAMQPTVNQFDVECIASAMVNPELHWRTLYHMTVAPFEPFSSFGLPPPQLGSHYDANDFIGQDVIINGHHRFLAYLLSGVPPPDVMQFKVNRAALATSMFPWSVVEWGA